MPEKILVVDDDLNVLEGYSRTLRCDYHVQVADSGKEALRMLRARGPFAVVVADMRMPGMDGIELLRAVEQAAPDTVRIMLTGNADLQTAIDAVNDGHIFRFLTKPCPKDVLARALDAGLAQYRLVVAERELLEGTVKGSVRAMVDLLSLANPAAFGRASRVRHHVRLLCRQMRIRGTWQYELAAMLSQIGLVTLPSDLVAKLPAEEHLSDDDRKLLAAHPEVGGRLLAHIPRLADVSQMVARQAQPWSQMPEQADLDDPVTLGSQLLHVALDLDALLASGLRPRPAVETIKQRGETYNPTVLAALDAVDFSPAQPTVQNIPLRQLRRGMIIEQDVRTIEGKLLVGKGQEVTLTILEHLHHWSHRTTIREPIQVRMPYGLESPLPSTARAAENTGPAADPEPAGREAPGGP